MNIQMFSSSFLTETIDLFYRVSSRNTFTIIPYKKATKNKGNN